MHFFWILGSEVSGENKRVVTSVPNRKPVMTFMHPEKIKAHKSHKWFVGYYSLVAGKAGSLPLYKRF